MSTTSTCVALLRGINVGGHHKVPMAALREELHAMGLKNVRTLLNSGNAVFETSVNIQELQDSIETRLSEAFGFSIPVILRDKKDLVDLVENNPFDAVHVTKDIRLYVSFLKNLPENPLNTPWISQDNTFQIISIYDRMICSVLDLSTTKTPKGMDELEKLFGKEITTRNWNTVRKIAGV